MTSAFLSFRILAALVVLATVTVICASLGRWQLNRAAEREAIHADIIAGRELPPLEITPGISPGQLQDWRPAKVSGHWLNRYTLLLANRNMNGRPGYWVATPLRLESEADTGLAILVLRGWIPRPLGPNAQLPSLDAPDTLQHLHGELRKHVPRLFDLGNVSGTSDTGLPANPADSARPLELQNLDLENFTTITGIKLLPAVLQQTSASALKDGTPLIQNWPTPSLDSDKNRGYALQWFAFASITAGAWLVIVGRLWRRRSQHRTNASQKE